jgi:hypothetical protein
VAEFILFTNLVCSVGGNVIFNFEKEVHSTLGSNRLYRFRRFDEDNQAQELDALLNDYLWAPTYAELNDPMEAFFGTVSYESEGQSISDSLDKAIGYRERLVDLNNSLGIISFTQSVENLPMWAYYARNFTGICLEFDVAALCLGDLFGGGPFKVDYLPEPLPYHDIDLEFSEISQIHKDRNLLSKPIGWLHEQEWRFIAGRGRNYYPRHALKAIWVGPNCPFQNWFVDFGKQHAIKIYQTRPQDFKLLFDEHPVSGCYSSQGCHPMLLELTMKGGSLNKYYLNNLEYVFNNDVGRRNFSLLSAAESQNQLVVKGRYTYANGDKKIFTEIYDLDLFKVDSLWGGANRSPRPI